ncbi:hypothetical protein [Ideonella sp. A 288]|uniref:hypothetical protein n=1 Tax=Ideonella sp. A 288 TaxID=1962181 RepID=UPI000B4ADA1A|nr:hypothetical protein [Ideonella sp. A 288]
MSTDAAPSADQDGRQAFTDALRELLTNLPGQGLHEMWWVDESFEAWPLDEPAVLEALSRWSRVPGRRLHIVGSDFELTARRHPRFAAWRRDRAHVTEAWRPLPTERTDLPVRLLAGDRGVELLDRVHWHWRRVDDRATLVNLMSSTADLLHRCESAWPITTLGL